MRMDLFQQYQRLSFSYYDRNNTGEMMSKLVTDLFDISEVAHHGPENLFIATLKIVGSFVLLMFINVPLTLVMLAVTAVMATYAFCPELPQAHNLPPESCAHGGFECAFAGFAGRHSRGEGVWQRAYRDRQVRPRQ